MTRSLRIASLCFVLGCLPQSPAAEPDASGANNRAVNVSRTVEPGSTLDDPRLGAPRTTHDKHHPWTPASTKAEWEKQAQAIRERILVSTGLWPMPPKAPLEPVIHGKINRGSYTIEKVYFVSHPGHYVSGNLYRPARVEGKVPGVLCPHGHWQNGRFHDAGEKEAASQLKQRAETNLAGARYPLQARMAQLAKLGCVVFHYDMVGMADSKQIGHSQGFTDADASLRLQNFLGLQTFNSICALDFLLSLPEVDPTRIGVTGSSGGGTQTFFLCAIDSRPIAAFPAVMVSSNMQGGCVCENAEYLRIGVNNVAFAALFAPKPLAMSAANDWTIDIETKGLPELKQVYALYDRADAVHAKCFPQFGHNYNQVAREMMYDWFNVHLALGRDGEIQEDDFWPIAPGELSVYDQDHPRPADAASSQELRKHLTRVAEQQFAELVPKHADGLEKYRRMVGAAARVMLDEGVPSADKVESTLSQEELEPGVSLMKGVITRTDGGDKVPYVVLVPQSFQGSLALWIDVKGKQHLFDKEGKPTAAVRKLLDKGEAVASIDVLLTGESVTSNQKPAVPAVDKNYAGYTFAFNRPLFANRVRDILTTLGATAKHGQAHAVRLIGTGDAGPWVLLAAGLARDNVQSVVADSRGLDFSKLKDASDPNFLPGVLKYGGLGGMTALAAPCPLTLYSSKSMPPQEVTTLEAVYAASGAKPTLHADAPVADQPF